MIVGVDAVFVFVEFGVEFGHLIRRESKVLLSVSNLFVEVCVLLQQIVYLLLQQIVLLIVSSDSVLVFVELLNNFIILAGRKP